MTNPTPYDDFYPSARFAKVPAEALGPLALEGSHKMGHAAFRVFVALCRFRGSSRAVHPSQDTLAAMTGMSRNNVSRAVKELAARGWLVAWHADGHPRKRVINYELSIPTPGVSPGVTPKATRAERNAAKAMAGELAARSVLSKPRGPQGSAQAEAPEDEVARDLAELVRQARLFDDGAPA